MQQQGCCAEGLVCDKDSWTCEIALGEPCQRKEIKRFFKKNIKPDKCGDNYRGRWITCGHPDPHGVSHCCVKSWVLQEKGTYYRKAKGTEFYESAVSFSPVGFHRGNAHLPLELNSSRTCCSDFAYIYPDGYVACADDTYENKKIAQKYELKVLTT
ncbi:unnamed protein product [Durusdinium trenchii]